MQWFFDNVLMKYSDKLGAYIRFRRENAEISLNKFAIEVEMESSTLSRNENNISDINIDNIAKIAKFYNQSVSEFLKNFEDYVKANS